MTNVLRDVSFWRQTLAVVAGNEIFFLPTATASMKCASCEVHSRYVYEIEKVDIR